MKPLDPKVLGYLSKATDPDMQKARETYEREIHVRELQNDIRRYERLVQAAESDLLCYRSHLKAAQDEFNKLTKEKDDE